MCISIYHSWTFKSGGNHLKGKDEVHLLIIWSALGQVLVEATGRKPYFCDYNFYIGNIRYKMFKSVACILC